LATAKGPEVRSPFIKSPANDVARAAARH